MNLRFAYLALLLPIIPLIGGCTYSAARNSNHSVTVYTAAHGGGAIPTNERLKGTIAVYSPLELRYQITNTIGLGLGYETIYFTSIQKPINAPDVTMASQGLTIPFIYRIPISQFGVLDIVPRATVGFDMMSLGNGAVKAGVAAMVGAVAWDYGKLEEMSPDNKTTPSLKVRTALFAGLDVGFIMMDRNTMAPYIAAVIMAVEIGFDWRD